MWKINELEFGISVNCIFLCCLCCLVIVQCLCFQSHCPSLFYSFTGLSLSCLRWKKLAYCTRCFLTILVFYFKSSRNRFQFITALVPEGVSTLTVAVLVSSAVLGSVVQLMEHGALMELCALTILPLSPWRR